MNWLAAALECIAAGDKAVLVTVAEAKGSTPRESGAKMLVRERDIVGSVGGGQLELLAIDEARRMMADGAKRPDLMRYSLGPDLGQCCGGAVRLLLEPLFQTDRRWLTKWQTVLAGPEAYLLTTSSSGEKSWTGVGRRRGRSEDHRGPSLAGGRDCPQRVAAGLAVRRGSRRSCAGQGAGGVAVRHDLAR